MKKSKRENERVLCLSIGMLGEFGKANWKVKELKRPNWP
jgi:hypothetical protein